MICGEPLAGRGAAALAVEDPGDRGVVVVSGESPEQCRSCPRRCGSSAGGAASATASSVIAPPCQRIVTVAWRCSRATSRMTSSIRQRSSCLRSRSVVVGAAHTRPRSAPSASSCSRSASVSVLRALLLAQRELGLGLGKRAERLLPVALQAAGDETVLGLDLAVATLGPLGLVSRLLDLQPPLRERGVVVVLERLGRGERRLHAGGGQRRQERAGDGVVDLLRRRPACTSSRGPSTRIAGRDSDRRGSCGRAGLVVRRGACVRSGRTRRSLAAARCLRARRRRLGGRAGECWRRSAHGWPRRWPCRCSRGGDPRSRRPILLGAADASAGGCCRARRRSAPGGSSRTRRRLRRRGCRARCGSGGRSGPSTGSRRARSGASGTAPAPGASTAIPGGPSRARRNGRRSSGSHRGSPRRDRAGSRRRPRPTPARPAAPCAARRARPCCGSRPPAGRGARAARPRYIVPLRPNKSRSLNEPG